MANKPLVIDRFNMGGISDSKFQGTPKSFYKMIGCDVQSQVGILQIAHKFVENSGGLVNELVKNMVITSTGELYAFSSTSGKVWRRNVAGAWSLAYTTSAGAGESKCLGAREYNGFIYWATELRLHRISIALLSDWATNAVPNYQTFTVSEKEFRPMIVQNLNLYIGNGKYIAQIEAGTFTEDALDLPTEYRVSALGVYNTDLLIGTTIDGKVNKSLVLRWNTWSVSWDVDRPIYETAINSFINLNGDVFAQAGQWGNLYYYNGVRLQFYKQLLGDYSLTKLAKINANASSEYNGFALFGVSSVSGDPVESVVFEMGSRNPQIFPNVITSPYVPSSALSTGNEIGAIEIAGQDVYIAWKNGTDYGIDKLDYDSYLSLASIETRTIYAGTETQISWNKVAIMYIDLPTGTDIKLYYKTVDEASYHELVLKNDTIRKCKYNETKVEQNNIQFKIELISDGTATPLVNQIVIYP